MQFCAEALKLIALSYASTLMQFIPSCGKLKTSDRPTDATLSSREWAMLG
jgi:hypothetical protein